MVPFNSFSHFVFLSYVLLSHMKLGFVTSVEGKEKKLANSKSNSYIKKETGFFIGKFIHGQYLEYHALNGFSTPKSAMKICEADFECAGFTYQGAKTVDQKFYILFFRYVAPPSISLSSVTNEEKVWTSYRVKRSFVVLPRRKEIGETSNIASNVDNEISTFCENVLSIMRMQSDDKKISFGNKIKWIVPNIKAITIDPFSKQHKDNPESHSSFAISELYENEEVFTLKKSNESRDQSTLLTFIRLDPAIEDINDGKSSIILVSLCICVLRIEGINNPQ